ncbi:hypothetical protein RFI_02579, partial [Reticulomyxa filosa]
KNWIQPVLNRYKGYMGNFTELKKVWKEEVTRAVNTHFNRLQELPLLFETEIDIPANAGALLKAKNVLGSSIVAMNNSKKALAVVKRHCEAMIQDQLYLKARIESKELEAIHELIDTIADTKTATILKSEITSKVRPVTWENTVKKVKTRATSEVLMDMLLDMLLDLILDMLLNTVLDILLLLKVLSKILLKMLSKVLLKISDILLKLFLLGLWLVSYLVPFVDGLSGNK